MVHMLDMVSQHETCSQKLWGVLMLLSVANEVMLRPSSCHLKETDVAGDVRFQGA